MGARHDTDDNDIMYDGSDGDIWKVINSFIPDLHEPLKLIRTHLSFITIIIGIFVGFAH